MYLQGGKKMLCAICPCLLGCGRWMKRWDHTRDSLEWWERQKIEKNEYFHSIFADFLIFLPRKYSGKKVQNALKMLLKIWNLLWSARTSYNYGSFYSTAISQLSKYASNSAPRLKLRKALPEKATGIAFTWFGQGGCTLVVHCISTMSYVHLTLSQAHSHLE